MSRITKPRIRAELDAGVASLPILCSLLGAVILVRTFEPLRDEFVARLEKDLARVEEEAVVVLGRLDRVSQALGAHEEDFRRLALAEALQKKLLDLGKAEKALEARIGALSEEDAKRRKGLEERDALSNEVASIKARVISLEKEADRLGAVGDMGFPFGAYGGRYLIVECRAKEVVVYPEAEAIAAPMDDRSLDRLVGQIENLGAVAVLARPSSFDSVYPRIYVRVRKLASDGFQARAGGTNARPVVCFWPIDENEPIDRYLPSEKEN